MKIWINWFTFLLFDCSTLFWASGMYCKLGEKHIQTIWVKPPEWNWDHFVLLDRLYCQLEFNSIIKSNIKSHMKMYINWWKYWNAMIIVLSTLSRFSRKILWIDINFYKIIYFFTNFGKFAQILREMDIISIKIGYPILIFFFILYLYSYFYVFILCNALTIFSTNSTKLGQMS